MKYLAKTLGKIPAALSFCLALTILAPANANLIITGVMDGPLSGGEPKIVELFATSDIVDLAGYGLESATNSAVATAIETPLAGSISAGEFLYAYLADSDLPAITPIEKLSAFLGFTPANTIHHSAPGSGTSFNGDDGIVLWNGATIVDRFGRDADADDPGEDWDYQDGWAYRNNGTGPDTSFVMDNWTFSGEHVFDGQVDNTTAPVPFPTGSYSVPEPGSVALLLLGSLVFLAGLRR